MTFLLDANVLIYAFREDSPQHAGCLAWLQGVLESGATVLLPDLVEVALLRVCTHPSLGPAAAPTLAVFAFLRDLHGLPNCLRVGLGEEGFAIYERLCAQLALRGNDVNDVYLAALALEHGAVLASADRGFSRFPLLDWVDPLQEKELR